MTEAVQVAIIVSAGPTVLGVLNLIHQVIVAKKMTSIGDNIQKVETATNHMHDALVASTKIASHAEGVQDEKIRVANNAGISLDTVISGPHITP